MFRLTQRVRNTYFQSGNQTVTNNKLRTLLCKLPYFYHLQHGRKNSISYVQYVNPEIK